MIGKYKTCTKCGKEKQVGEFNKNKTKANGETQCKQCCIERSALWSLSNKEKVRKNKRAWAEKNKDRLNAASKERYRKNPQQAIRYSENWRRNNLDRFRELQRQSALRHRGDIRRIIHRRVATSMRRIILSDKTGRKWETLLGYTATQLREHLENQFTAGMTWELFLAGEIHIDHKIPLAVFNFTSCEDIDFKRCWSLANLQPLWRHENQSKGDKIARPFQPSLLIQCRDGKIVREGAN